MAGCGLRVLRLTLAFWAGSYACHAQIIERPAAGQGAGLSYSAPTLSLPAASTASAQTYSAHTYIDPIDRLPRDCFAQPRAGGNLMLVKGRNDGSLRFWGYSTWDAAGHPWIILNTTVLGQLPPIMTRFTFYHECAHLVLRSSDEVQASCEALKRMRANRELGPGDEPVVRREHERLSFLGVKYLGNGRALWQATTACADARQASAAGR
jgi:hypothetical protein